uniref:Uncharacterized protein n=1 Tax=Caenorhabditis japonica TaxID=281687 RepID=A0A8R1HGW5_CAEJA
MYTTSLRSEDLHACRKYARAVISASFISSLRNIQNLRRMDESIETIRLKLTRKPKIAESPETSVTSTATTTPRIKVAHEPPQKTKKAPEKATRPKNWSPITDGKKAIISLIDQIVEVAKNLCVPAQVAANILE